MRKYFTKYYPARKTEINPGDKFFYQDKLLTCGIGPQRLPGGGERVRAELYICSKDVQVGDKIIWPLTVGKLTVYLEDTVTEIQVRKRKIHAKVQKLTKETGLDTWVTSPIKKIGRISEYALTFVKEGQRFNREDLVANGVGVNWHDKFAPYNFTIKGPCKHFH